MAPWSWGVRLRLGEAGWRGQAEWEWLGAVGDEAGRTQGGWVNGVSGKPEKTSLWVAPEPSLDPEDLRHWWRERPWKSAKMRGEGGGQRNRTGWGWRGEHRVRTHS